MQGCAAYGPWARIWPARHSIWPVKACCFCYNLMDSCHCNITIRFASGQQSRNTRTTFDNDCHSIHGKTDRILRQTSSRKSFKISPRISVIFHNVHTCFYHAMLSCYASTVSVCLCLSQVGVLLKRLNTGSHKQHHTIAQGL